MCLFERVDLRGAVPVLELDAVSTMHWMDGDLAAHDDLAADRFTVADITAMAGFAYADLIKLDIPESCAHPRRWRHRVSSRPSAALAA